MEAEPILQSTLSDEVFTQTCVIERESGTRDQLGGIKDKTFAVHLSGVPCRIWFWKGSKSSDRSPSEQYARPQATVNDTGGEMALPLGTDINELTDRIAKVLDASGRQITTPGPYRIEAMTTYDSHIELALEKP